ncbi:acyltransferase domain-containing protein, partial [Streptomyces sp. NPDC086519]|uniref:acyltransferase domain-containing protein n=1 Tax=Streptomyces sp. NPDC086519 TaxID=3154863 RepID=UPI00341BF15E
GAGRAVLGSVKSMIGHTMPAAGVAGLVKAALALHHATLLPTLHCEDPHPALAATRFRTLDRARPWETVPQQPVRRAGVNAFGFGGINAHVVLEEAPHRRAAAVSRGAGVIGARGAEAAAPRRAEVTEPERILLLAADSPNDLTELLDTSDAALLAAGLDPSRPHPQAGPARLGIIDPTARRLLVARRAVARGRVWQGRNDVWFVPGRLGGRLAFVFPGLEADFHPQVDDVAAHFGLPGTLSGAQVGDVGRHGFQVVAVGRLLDTVLRRMGVVPDAVAGHSIGEWTAMTAAGVYSEEDVGDFMASFDPGSLAVPGLAFGAVGAPAERVLADLDRGHWAEAGIVLSHDNAPNQSMVCGPDEAVTAFLRSLRARGVLCQVLPFRSGFHTPMLKPYLAPIEAAARRFRLHPQTVPLWSATTAAPYPEAERDVRELFVRHLLEPVRFRQLIEALYAAGHRTFVQMGSGRLASLIGDILGDRDHLAVAANSPHRPGVAQLRRVAVALWTAGAQVVPVPSSRTPAGSQQRPPVRLDLGGALVSLDERTRTELRADLRSAPARLPAPSALDALASRSPAAAELSALLRDTADAAAELITVGGPRPTTAHPPAARSPVRTPVPLPVRAVSGAPMPPASSLSPTPPAPWRTTLRVSLETMPYLLDHCFFPQRPDWPETGDRFPVVPATTIVHHIMAAAEQAAPGKRAVAVRGARFDQWLTAIPPVDVPVTVTADGPQHVAVTFGSWARAVVELAARYPAAVPAPWPTDPAAERLPAHTAAQLYTERWMFHGPAFQGITELTAIGSGHVRGVITAPAAPGALLDNVGQLLGYWIMATHTERTVVFPVHLGELRCYGPHPSPGREVGCLVRIVSLTDTALEADVQLTVDGRVWAEVTGWQDRRFDNDPKTRPAERFPERHTFSEARSGGWVLVHERWPDLASRELVMRNSLGGAERAEYGAHPPRGRRQWLLGRIAVKDAVRHRLWEHGEGPVFPAEIRVCGDWAGRPYVTGLHGRRLPPLDVSLAHRAEAAVAIARPHTPGPGPGIDIEEVTAHDPATLDVALGAGELRLLHALSTSTDDSQALWFTRFWAAKEAVAKAEGTGFGGRPRDFRVREATADRLVVSGRLADTYVVRCELTSNPPRLPDRDYVVAWTTGPTQEKEYDR